MYKKILVSELIQEGQRLLEALARKRFPLRGALWFYNPESMEWRLVIATPAVDRAGPLATYTRLHRVFETVSPSQLSFSDISLMSPSGQEYQDLWAAVGAPNRFGAAIGPPPNVVFDDAYVYHV